MKEKKRKEKGDEQEKQSKEYTQVWVGSDTRLPPFTITYRMISYKATLMISSLFCVYISQNICPVIHMRAASKVKTWIVRSSFVIGSFLRMALSRSPASYPLFWAISMSIWATSAIPSLSNHGHSMRVKVYHRPTILIIKKLLREIKYDASYFAHAK